MLPLLIMQAEDLFAADLHLWTSPENNLGKATAADWLHSQATSQAILDLVLFVPVGIATSLNRCAKHRRGRGLCRVGKP